MGQKLCARCNKTKELVEFPLVKNRKGVLVPFSYCVACKSEAYKEWHQNNPVRRKQITEKFYESNPGRKEQHQHSTYMGRRKRCLSDIVWYNIRGRIRNPKPKEEKYYKHVKLLVTKDEFTVIWNASSECAKCKISFEAQGVQKTVDRISSLGNYEKNNIQFLCLPCHGRKTREDNK